MRSLNSGGGCDLERDGLACDDVHERTALLTREDRGVELLGIVLLGENETGARAAEGLVSSGGYDIGVWDRARMQSGGDEAREVCHVNPELGSDFVGDLLHGLEVFDTRVGAPAADDHGRVGFERALADDFRVDAEGFGIDSVGFGMVEASGEVDFHAVGEVSAMVEGEAEHGVARLDERLVDGCIGLCAGVRLHVDVFGAEQALGAFAGDGFDLVNLLAAAVVAASRIAFGILVGQHGALRLKHGTRHEVFGGDHFQAVLLSGQFGVEYLGDFGVRFGDGRVEHVVRGLRERRCGH